MSVAHVSKEENAPIFPSSSDPISIPSNSSLQSQSVGIYANPDDQREFDMWLNCRLNSPTDFTYIPYIGSPDISNISSPGTDDFLPPFSYNNIEKEDLEFTSLPSKFVKTGIIELVNGQEKEEKVPSIYHYEIEEKREKKEEKDDSDTEYNSDEFYIDDEYEEDTKEQEKAEKKEEEKKEEKSKKRRKYRCKLCSSDSHTKPRCPLNENKGIKRKRNKGQEGQNVTDLPVSLTDQLGEKIGQQQEEPKKEIKRTQYKCKRCGLKG